MMDAQLVFCESMSIAATAGSHVHSTNMVSLPATYNFKGTAMDDSPNNSGNLFLNIVVEDENLTAASNSSVVTFYLYNGATGTAPLPDNSGVAIMSKSISVNSTSNYPDGTLICSMPLPAGPLKRHFDLYVTVATQNLSTGKITAWLGAQPQLGT